MPFFLPGGLVSYSMPQGDKRGSNYEFYDWNYDGDWRNNQLTNGLGSLTDGNLGPDDYKLSYYPKSEELIIVCSIFCQCEGF